MGKVCIIKTTEIENGSYLMYGNKNLHTWDSDLNVLHTGYRMFSMCNNLTSFKAATPMLSNGEGMFNYSFTESIGTIEMDFDELTHGEMMFANNYNLHLGNNKATLNGFIFPKLIYGYGMFANTYNVATFQHGGDYGLDHCFNMKFPELLDASFIFQYNRDYGDFTSSDMFPKVRNFSYAFEGSYITSFDVELYKGCTEGLPFVGGLHWGVSLDDGMSDFSYMFKDSQLEDSYIKLSSDLPQNRNYSFNCTGMFQGCVKLKSVEWDERFGKAVVSATNFCQGCYELTDVNGNLPFVENGSNMFEHCYNLTAFSSDLSSLTNGENMFYNCSKLTSFSSNLSSLTNGSMMFSGCKLSYVSFRNIIDSLPTYAGGSNEIDITVQNSSDVINGFKLDDMFAGMTSVVIPKVGSNPFVINYKGWKINLTATSQFTFNVTTGDDEGGRDIVVGSEFIPNASGWYAKHGSAKDIVAVYNGYAWDDEPV